jgi:hypothetical protein
VERLPLNALHRRLHGLGAVAQPDRNTRDAHIYFAPSSRRWIKVTRDRDPNLVVLEFSATCPCGG